MMNPEIKAQWIAALRSGEYKQAHGQLFNGEGYCCIGVLAHIQGCPIAELRNQFTSATPDGYDAGLCYKEMSRLALMNDAGNSFAMIADAIEETVE